RGACRRGLADGQPSRRAERADHGAGVRPARLAGAARLHRGGADPLRQAPGGRGAAEPRTDRCRGARDAVVAEFLMPALGADMRAGTLMSWLKKPGDVVRRGDIVALVHTDKADVEVEVFANGVLDRTLVEPGT